MLPAMIIRVVDGVGNDAWPARGITVRTLHTARLKHKGQSAIRAAQNCVVANERKGVKSFLLPACTVELLTRDATLLKCGTVWLCKSSNLLLFPGCLCNTDNKYLNLRLRMLSSASVPPSFIHNTATQTIVNGNAFRLNDSSRIQGKLGNLASSITGAMEPQNRLVGLQKDMCFSLVA